MAHTVNPDEKYNFNPEATDSVSQDLNKKELTHKQKIVMGVSGAALALIAAGFGVSKAVEAKSDSIKATTTTEQTNNGSSEATSSSSQENSVESYADSMKRYESMSVSEFENLGIDDKLRYSQYLIDRTRYDGTYDTLYGVGGPGYQYKVEKHDLSIDSSGQDILDNWLYTTQMTFAQLGETTAGEDYNYDPTDAEKMLSSIFYRANEIEDAAKLYSAEKDELEKSSKTLALGQIDTAMDSSNVLQGKDKDGNAVQYKIIKLKQTTPHSENPEYVYGRFIYHEFVNYDGQKDAIWLVDLFAKSYSEINNTDIN